MRARPNPELPLLPNANKIQVENFGNLRDLERSLSFLPETLTELEWTALDRPVSGQNDTVLSTLATRFPLLHRLDVSCIAITDTRDLPYLVTTLPDLNNLRDLGLDGINFTQQLADAVMMMPSLTALSVGTFGVREVVVGVAPEPVLCWKRFAGTIERLDVPFTVEGVDLIVALGTSHSLRSLSITDDWNDGFATDFETAFRAVALHHELRGLKVTSTTSLTLSPQALSSLKAIRSVETLSFDVAGPAVTMDDIGMDDFLSHWSSLRYLELAFHKTGVNSGPPLTFRSVEAALSRCPRLESLRMAVNATLASVSAECHGPPSSLKTFSLCTTDRKCSTVEDAGRVACFLSGASEDLEVVNHCGRRKCSSEVLRKWLPHLQAARRQERSRVQVG